MTLARKHTRPITVDGVGYRWMLKETDYGAMFELLLVVEADDPPHGEQLVAHVEADQRRETDAVTPAVVAELVREARALGWSPERRGSRPPLDDALLRLVRARSAPR